MEDIYQQFIDEAGLQYRVTRGGTDVGSVLGHANTRDDLGTRRRFLMLTIGTDVRPGDILTGELTGEKCFIDEVTPKVFLKEVAGLDAFYHTERDLEEHKQRASGSQTWTIETNYGIVGNQGVASQHFVLNIAELEAEIERRGEDVEELRDLVRSVAEIENVPALLQGHLARYSALLEKHSWITGSVLNSILSWLLSGNVRS